MPGFFLRNRHGLRIMSGFKWKVGHGYPIMSDLSTTHKNLEHIRSRFLIIVYFSKQTSQGHVRHHRFHSTTSFLLRCLSDARFRFP